MDIQRNNCVNKQEAPREQEAPQEPPCNPWETINLINMDCSLRTANRCTDELDGHDKSVQKLNFGNEASILERASTGEEPSTCSSRRPPSNHRHSD